MEDCMSMQYRIPKKCVLCEREHTYPMIVSTSTFGACDLDLRPSELKRSTMPLWVMECPFCGYVAADISKLPTKTAEKRKVQNFVSSIAFLGAGDKNFENELAARFYKQHTIAIAFGDENTAFYALLYAAWACDDAKDKGNALFCRKKALEFLEPLILKDAGNENLPLIKADLLRRSGSFDAVIEQFSSKKLQNEAANKIVHFQVEKSKLKDDACYTVLDAQQSDPQA